MYPQVLNFIQLLKYDEMGTLVISLPFTYPKLTKIIDKMCLDTHGLQPAMSGRRRRPHKHSKSLSVVMRFWC